MRTGKKRLLTRSEKHDDAIMRGPDTLSFSPNKKYLLLVYGGGRFWHTHKRLLRLDYPSGKRKWLTGTATAAFLPVWSPGGRRIAYIAVPDSNVKTNSPVPMGNLYRQHLWVMRSDGQGKRRLTQDTHYHETAPRWLPDGQHIQFIRQENQEDWRGKRSLWVINVNGNHLRRLRSLPPEQDS